MSPHAKKAHVGINNHSDHESVHDNHEHHTGKRLKQFLRGDGRKVHVASSHEKMLKLRSAPKDEGTDIDIVIHGSPEHVEALRDCHAHHEKIRTALREKHAGAWFEVDNIIRQIDNLAEELHLVSENAVQLDASFSKYGYDAHIRTHDNSPNHSGTSSLHEDSEGLTKPRDWSEERFKIESLKFFVKPVVRQYFHKGLLWRAKEIQEVSAYELFVDLLYVAIVAITGDSAAEAATGAALLRFVITFTMAWKYWNELTLAMAYFDADDVLRRLGVLFVLACLLGFTTNMAGFNDGTYTPLVAYYLAGRLFSTAYTPAFWIASIHVDGGTRQAMIWIALFFDTFGQSIFFIWTRMAEDFSWLEDWRAKHLDFVPAINIEHRIARTGGFVTLVLGYSVVSLLYQNASAMGPNAFLGKAIMGLLQAFSFNIIYFEIDTFNIHTHAIRRHHSSAFAWLCIHLPFMMSFVIAGAALSRIVLAHDCRNADPDTLMNTYASKSAAHISSGVRWFYCAGLGISLLCTAVIATSHAYKTPRNFQYSERTRVAIRFIVGVAIVFLGFAKSLNSVELIATTTRLVGLIVISELLCDMLSDENQECNLSDWRTLTSRLCDRRRKCKYMARCHVSRKVLEESVRNGLVVKTGELKGEKGGYDFG